MKSIGNKTFDIQLSTRAIVPERTIDGDHLSRYFLYADPFFAYKGKSRLRNDWVFFKWEPEELGDDSSTDSFLCSSSVPVKALIFLTASQDSVCYFGSGVQEGSTFALINPLFAEASTYFDITEDWKPNHWLHPSSRLLFRGHLEMETPRIPMCRLVGLDS